MKKQIATMSLMTVFALAGSIYAVHADPLAGRMMGEMRGGAGDGSGGGRHLAKMAKVLDLSEAQQAQIQTILAAERAKTEPLRQQMEADREQMRQLVQADSFDEAAVRALASKKAEVGTELMVSRARTQNLIQAQLTPEQRERAEKVRPLMQEQRGGKGRHHNDGHSSRKGDCPQPDGQL
ncbi:Spy/CpxP family protein refolding chaperone [Trichloromonas sp.]|uniref:Spy/CpxP family protein refolding chaperone n=1 Tax=Trichloromonas sp. TaxID=3069249 RepID=UPI003D818C3A